MSEEQMRAAFEKAFVEVPLQLDKDSPEYYVEFNWRLWKLAWQAALSAKSVPDDGWIKGAPEKHWAKEWFIAVLDNGDRVVLTALPEEYSYDFKTADETYFKSYRIKKWMQFPDSEYIAPQVPTDYERVRELERTLELFRAATSQELHERIAEIMKEEIK